MKKVLILNLFLLLTVFVYCQDNNELDKRNGFKSIKIGSLLSSFGNEVKFAQHFSETNADCFFYEPKDKDLYKVFNININSILLTFDKNKKLVTILLRKTYPQSSGDLALKTGLELIKNLKIIFGNQSGYIDVNNKHENRRTGAYWGSKNLILKCYMVMQTQENSMDLSVCFQDLNYLSNSVESGF